MTRSVKEWIGKSDDEAIPARVKIRVFDRCNGQCRNCGVRIGASVRPAFDHVVALVNGGQNRETNLQLLCLPCHSQKTQSDVAQKAATYRKRLTHLGIKPRKGRPMPGSKASGIRKRMNGAVERRTS